VLTTVLSAKGLEWDAVFLAGMEDGVLPHANADDIEEERRIAYVGVTRASGHDRYTPNCGNLRTDAR
jgi:DNA helicase-2/ATP-dependent DNA helicase PcrA